MSYTRNGYKMIYMPNHHRAIHKMVYEHVYLMEQYIGRPLKDGEEVHHMDENKLNNSEENLILFRTKGDHSRYHKTGIMIEMEDGTYISPKEVEVRICEQCGKKYEHYRNGEKFCSKECSEINQRRSERPSKE